MDEFKEKTLRNYSIHEIKCKYIGSNKGKRKLKEKFRRASRRVLKMELNKSKELLGEEDE